MGRSASWCIGFVSNCPKLRQDARGSLPVDGLQVLSFGHPAGGGVL